MTSVKKGSLVFSCVLLLALLGAAIVRAAEEPATTATVRITAGDTIIEAELNNSPAAVAFLKTLPVTLSMRRLYDREFYTVLDEALPIEGQQAFEQYELGDIAFWTKGNYFGILYSFDRPQLSSPIVKVGSVTSSLEEVRNLGSGTAMKFELVK